MEVHRVLIVQSHRPPNEKLSHTQPLGELAANLLWIISPFQLEKVLLFIAWSLTALQDSKFLWFHEANFQGAWFHPAKKQICKFLTSIFIGERWEASCFRWVIRKETVRYMHALKRVEWPDWSIVGGSKACNCKLVAGNVMIIIPALTALKWQLRLFGSDILTFILALNKAAKSLNCNLAYQILWVRSILCQTVFYKNCNRHCLIESFWQTFSSNELTYSNRRHIPCCPNQNLSN